MIKRNNCFSGTSSGPFVVTFHERAKQENSVSSKDTLYDYSLHLLNSNSTGGLQVEAYVGETRIDCSISFNVSHL